MMIALAAGLMAGGAASAQDHELALVHVAGEATFVDLKTVRLNDHLATFRALVVAKTGQPQVGGWRSMLLDCDQNEFHRLSVAVVDEAGKPGPDQPLSGQPFPVLSGSPEDAMAAAVCDKKPPFPDRAPNIAEATKLGRAKLAG